MKTDYLQKLPSFLDAYNKYVTDKRWNCYKKNLVKSITDRRRKPHCIDSKDVPGILKAEQIYYLSKDDII